MRISRILITVFSEFIILIYLILYCQFSLGLVVADNSLICLLSSLMALFCDTYDASHSKYHKLYCFIYIEVQDIPYSILHQHDLHPYHIMDNEIVMNFVFLTSFL